MNSPKVSGHIEALDIWTDASVFPEPAQQGAAVQLGAEDFIEAGDFSQFGELRGLFTPAITDADAKPLPLGTEGLDLISPDDICIKEPSKFALYKADRDLGERLVRSFAENPNFWNQNVGADTPWNPAGLEYAEENIAYLPATSGFVAGVLSYIRKAKQEIKNEGVTEATERGMAAGFLILSCFSAQTLSKLHSNIDFKRTCEDGCNYSKAVVSAAARYTSIQLGYAAAA